VYLVGFQYKYGILCLASGLAGLSSVKKKPPMATEYEVRWTPELTWTFCRRVQFLSLTGSRNTIS